MYDHYPFHENHEEEIRLLHSNPGHLCHKSPLIALIDDALIPSVKHSVTLDWVKMVTNITYGLFWSAFIIKLQGFPVIHWYGMKK